MRNKISILVIFYMVVLVLMNSFAPFKPLYKRLDRKVYLEKGIDLPTHQSICFPSAFFNLSEQGFEPLVIKFLNGFKNGTVTSSFYKFNSFYLKPAYGFYSVNLFIVYNNLRL